MLSSKNNIEIGISKRKGIVMTIVASIIFSIGIWALIEIQSMDSELDRIFLMILLTLIVLSFGFFGFLGIYRIIKNEVGLLIDDIGIKINVGPNKGHFVNWNEITELKTHNQLQGPIFLLIFVKKPDKFIQNSTGIKRLQLKMNNKSHKTPLSIATNWLECSFEELLEIMEEKIMKNGAQQKI